MPFDRRQAGRHAARQAFSIFNRNTGSLKSDRSGSGGYMDIYTALVLVILTFGIGFVLNCLIDQSRFRHGSEQPRLIQQDCTRPHDPSIYGWSNDDSPYQETERNS
jgi:hypothetical protein